MDNANVSVQSTHTMHAESDHQMIPADLVIESTSRLLASTSTAALLRLKADTHFTVPQRVEG